MSILITIFILVLAFAAYRIIRYRRYLGKSLSDVISPQLKHDIEKEDAQASRAARRFKRMLDQKLNHLPR